MLKSFENSENCPKKKSIQTKKNNMSQFSFFESDFSTCNKVNCSQGEIQMKLDQAHESQCKNGICEILRHQLHIQLYFEHFDTVRSI